MEIFIYILISANNSNAYCTSCSEGENFFYNQRFGLNLPLDRYKHIFIPILNRRHFTLVYINTQSKAFVYLNPIGEEENNFLDLFQFKTKTSNYNLVKLDHDMQNISKENYNCGVYICLFVKAILDGTSLLNMENPNNYRETMKTIFLQYADDLLSTCFHCGAKIVSPKIICSECERAPCEGCLSFHYKKSSDKFICMFCEEK